MNGYGQSFRFGPWIVSHCIYSTELSSRAVYLSFCWVEGYVSWWCEIMQKPGLIQSLSLFFWQRTGKTCWVLPTTSWRKFWKKQINFLPMVRELSTPAWPPDSFAFLGLNSTLLQFSLLTSSTGQGGCAGCPVSGAGDRLGQGEGQPAPCWWLCLRPLRLRRALGRNQWYG